MPKICIAWEGVRNSRYGLREIFGLRAIALTKSTEKLPLHPNPGFDLCDYVYMDGHSIVSAVVHNLIWGVADTLAGPAPFLSSMVAEL
jgi:hypothetical protein